MPKSKENMYATDTLMDERELVLRLIDGDEDAFCELYAAYKNRLLYFAMKFVKSREFAEDIFQDAFTVVWQSRRFINPADSPTRFLKVRFLHFHPAVSVWHDELTIFRTGVR